MHIHFLGRTIGVICIRVLLVAGLPINCHADFILTTYGVPTADNGSWAYSKAESVGRSNDISYQPLIADWSSAVFQGYVHQDSGKYPGIGGSWDTIGAGTHDEDTIYVFETFIMSQSDMVVPIHFDGDDGHAVYVNGVLIGGGGFFAPVDFDLVLTANTPVHIEIGDYNGPGAMAIQFFKQGSSVSLVNEPGLFVNAEGNFPTAPVPLPSALVLMLSGVPGFSLVYLRCRKVR